MHLFDYTLNSTLVSAKTLKCFYILMKMLVSLLFFQNNPSIMNNVSKLIEINISFHYLSVGPAVKVILLPEKPVEVNPVNVQPYLSPIVSTSFLYFQSEEK